MFYKDETGCGLVSKIVLVENDVLVWCVALQILPFNALNCKPNMWPISEPLCIFQLHWFDSESYQCMLSTASPKNVLGKIIGLIYNKISNYLIALLLDFYLNFIQKNEPLLASKGSRISAQQLLTFFLVNARWISNCRFCNKMISKMLCILRLNLLLVKQLLDLLLG